MTKESEREGYNPEAEEEPIQEGPGMFEEALRRNGLSDEEYRKLPRQKEKLSREIFGRKLEEKNREQKLVELEKMKQVLKSLEDVEFLEKDVLPVEEKISEIIPDAMLGKMVMLKIEYKHRDGRYFATEEVGNLSRNKHEFCKYLRRKLTYGKDRVNPRDIHFNIFGKTISLLKSPRIGDKGFNIERDTKVTIEAYKARELK